MTVNHFTSGLYALHLAAIFKRRDFYLISVIIKNRQVRIYDI